MTNDTPAAGLRIDHVSVVDPRDGSTAGDRTVVVRRGVIDAVRPSADARDEDLRVVDGAGRYVVPGYNNMHTHVLQQADRAALFMATMLLEGTTGMRQMAGSPQLLRRRAQGSLGLTRYTPRLLAMPGALLLPFSAPSAAKARRQIAAQAAQGADFIKLIQVDRDVFFASVGAAHENGLRIGGHLPAAITPAEASDAGYDSLEHLGTGTSVWIETSTQRAALREDDPGSWPIPAWVTGLPFAEQLFSSKLVTKITERALLNPALTHSPATVAVMRRALDSYDEKAARTLAATFARNATWQTPTLVRLRTQYRADAPEYDGHPWLAMLSGQARRDFAAMRQKFLALPETTRQTYHDYYAHALRFAGTLHQAGVPLMTGTDGPGGNPGQDLAAEFRELSAAGLPPLAILRAATSAPARYLGREQRMGAVATGMDADFLLLDADPLGHVDNLSRISAVVRDGHFLPRPEIQAIVERLAADPSALAVRPRPRRW
jgi:Amidohydrolase family